MNVSEQERHQSINNAVEASVRALHVPEVIQRLGHYAASLTEALSYVRTPDVRNGVVMLDDHRTNTIPAIALHISESALRRPQDVLFNAKQRYQINKKYKSGLAREIFYAHSSFYLEEPDVTPISFDDTRTEALTTADILAPAEDDCWQVYMRGRPAIAYNLDAPYPFSALNTIHEIAHAAQVNQQPISPTPFDFVRNELEAYHVTARVVQGYIAADCLKEFLANDEEYDTAHFALDVDTIRAEHHVPGPDPFAYNRQLIEELYEKDFRIFW